jgi:putative phosphoesterase
VARVGIVSDIHCDHVALAAVLETLADEVDEIWCAGDIVLQYRFCNDTTRLLRDANAVAIQGNHDMVLLSDDGRRAREAVGVDAAEVEWLAGLPYEHRARFEDVTVLMTHGSPWAPHGDYLSARNPQWRRADELGVDILVTGHTHEPMAEVFGSTLVVNPGSLGEPRQRDDRRGTYAILDTAARTATIEHVT